MNKNNINILVIISILFCSMLIFPFNAHAETICSYSASYKGENYETRFALSTYGDHYTYKDLKLTIDGTEIKSNDFSKLWVNIPNNTCPKIVLYYEIHGTGGGNHMLIGQEEDNKIKDILDSDVPAVKVPMYDSSKNTNIPVNVGSAGGIPNNKDYNLNYDGNVCDNENIKSAVKIVGKTISILQIAVPIILVVMALVDITKSIVSMDDSKSKKSINMLIKRLIAAVLVFFIIVIVKFICQLIVGDAMESCLNYIVNPW